ncbi:4Fe-4S binding protein [Clostridium estertheticum]|uniref:ATP-binding protein n=1 Tax=Clostridium estertheticum TaxID=238834 RepID=UPI001CF1B871|nr:4Fe-4S binding protein [Clostridium estertheticum]MCB2306370.1 4Fe-4S binding protein [Clostridium estertheticum]MCB2344746.1 4Fe-4S binding protein [Clostridium estertheticum]MCB2349669.1 4Fe-4S binding protein [Clostridium estertheticum]WAG46830.1 4Fe-4S binding protein [Clostridium estertheticum]
MKRNIINIDESKCNGCGLCINACHEGAIELVGGKAKLISDEYCDGLGDCLPECPVDAIKIIQRDAMSYDVKAVLIKKEQSDNKEDKKSDLPCGCPGTMEKSIKRNISSNLVQSKIRVSTNVEESEASMLNQWPVQLKLVNSKAGFLKGADILIAADCTAYAYGNFHKEFIKGRITLIGCPKLDDNDYYRDKIAEILENNEIKSITVVRMEVPCCAGIVFSVKEAMLKARVIVPYKEITIGINGVII